MFRLALADNGRGTDGEQKHGPRAEQQDGQPELKRAQEAGEQYREVRLPATLPSDEQYAKQAAREMVQALRDRFWQLVADGWPFVPVKSVTRHWIVLFGRSSMVVNSEEEAMAVANGRTAFIIRYDSTWTKKPSIYEYVQVLHYHYPVGLSTVTVHRTRNMVEC